MMWVLLLAVTAQGREVPHGLLPPRELTGPSRKVHDAVVNAGSRDIKAACDQRRQRLEELVEQGRYEEVIDVSRAFEGCDDDKQHVGFADITTTVATDHDRTRAVRASRIKINNETMPMVGASSKHYSGRYPVMGVAFNGTFIVAESPLRCSEDLQCESAEGKHSPRDLDDAIDLAQNLHRRSVVDDPEQLPIGISLGATNDKTTNYVVGTKSILVIPVCASNYPNCANRFNLNLVQSQHGGDVQSYLGQVLDVANDYFQLNSYGKFQLSPTFVPPRSLNYAQSNCGNVDPLDYWQGRKPGAMDVMAYNAAAALGYNVENYDFSMVVVDYCPSTFWSGIGYIGLPGSALNLRAFDYDASFVHELVHNFGGNHASFMTGGSKGAYAYLDAYYTGSWLEYGSPHSTMGRGDLEDGVGEAQLMIIEKAVFDWLPETKIKKLRPYNYNTGAGSCSPCGPFTLELVDDGALSSNANVYAGIEIECQALDTYFYIEHRKVTTENKNGALVYWTEVSNTRGGTGVSGNTILTDTTPETGNLRDAAINVGGSYTVYCGSSGIDNFPVQIYVEEHPNAQRLQVTLFASATVPPSVTPVPSSIRPSPAPTETCGTLCCTKIDGLPGSWSDDVFIRQGTSEGSCCSDRCAYIHENGEFYLQYRWGNYYATKTKPCHTGSSITYYGVFSVAQVTNACVIAPPTANPTMKPVPMPPPTLGYPFNVGYKFGGLTKVEFAGGIGDENKFSVKNQGSVFQVNDDTWVAVEIPAPVKLKKYTSFFFCMKTKSTQGKYHGIGLTNNPNNKQFGPWFAVYGTNNGPWIRNNKDYLYATTEDKFNKYQCFDVPAVDYYPLGASVTHLTFVNERQNSPSPYKGLFTGVTLNDNTDCGSNIDFTNLPVQDYRRRQNLGPVDDIFSIKQSGCRVELSGTTWKAFKIPRINVAQTTKLSFCYDPPSFQCSSHAISVLKNPTNQKTGPIFMVDGRNMWDMKLIRDFTYSSNFLEAQCFEIPLKDYMDIGDPIDYIALLNSCTTTTKIGAIWSKINIA